MGDDTLDPSNRATMRETMRELNYECVKGLKEENAQLTKAVHDKANEIDRLREALRWCGRQSTGDEGEIPVYVNELLNEENDFWNTSNETT